MKSRQPYSLKTRLLGYVLGAIAVTAAFQVVMAFQTTIHETDEIFDFQMQQVAFSLRPAVVGAELNVDAVLKDNDNDEDDKFLVQIWTADGKRSFHSNDYSQFLGRTTEGFSEVKLRDTEFRVFALTSGDHLIQIAQEVGVRNRISANLALRTVAPILITLPILMFLVWHVVKSALVPVDRLRAQLSIREGNQLQSLSPDGLPVEVEPLVEEINGHYAKINSTFESQRRFVADAAHELRSPIAALILQLELLARSRDADNFQQAVLRMKLGVARAARAVDQMLALEHQMNAQSKVVTLVPLYLNDVVSKAIPEAQLLAVAKDISLEVQNEGEPMKVVGDSEMLCVLLRNVIDNAIKYTPIGVRLAC